MCGYHRVPCGVPSSDTNDSQSGVGHTRAGSPPAVSLFFLLSASPSLTPAIGRTLWPWPLAGHRLGGDTCLSLGWKSVAISSAGRQKNNLADSFKLRFKLSKEGRILWPEDSSPWLAWPPSRAGCGDQRFTRCPLQATVSSGPGRNQSGKVLGGIPVRQPREMSGQGMTLKTEGSGPGGREDPAGSGDRPWPCARHGVFTGNGWENKSASVRIQGVTATFLRSVHFPDLHLYLCLTFFSSNDCGDSEVHEKPFSKFISCPLEEACLLHGNRP